LAPGEDGGAFVVADHGTAAADPATFAGSFQAVLGLARNVAATVCFPEEGVCCAEQLSAGVSPADGGAGARGTVVLDVQDSFCPWNTGRFQLQADGDSVSCERTSASPDIRLTSAELGAAFLGGTTLASLAAGGRVAELRPGALTHASTAFRGSREPFYLGGWAFPAY
jgi:hypothetical protein